jgi:phenylacetate-CoA ligase
MSLIRFLPRFRQADRTLQAMAPREHWTRVEMDAFQLERLNTVWRHARAHVPHYRQLQAEHGLPGEFASLQEFSRTVPVLNKQDIRRDPRRFLSERREPGTWTFTSGATGTPTPSFWSVQAHREMLAAKYRTYGWWGVGYLEPTVFLWGHAASFAPGWRGRLARWRQPWIDRLRSRLRLSAYYLGRDDLRAYLRQIARFRPASIYGYSSAVWLLAEEASATGFRCDSLKAIVCTSEPLSTAMRDTIEEAFGVPAIQEYGSLECGTLAGEFTDRTLRVCEDVNFVETVRRPDGHCDIIVTVLNNPSFPLLRYAIGDVTRGPLRRPEQGFAQLVNLGGRSHELLVTPSGRYLHPFWFDDVFETTTGARRWQIHQQADRSLCVSVELNRPSGCFDTGPLQRRISDHFEGCPVSVQVVDSIPPTIGGKHLWIVSDAVRSSSLKQTLHQ